MVRKVELVIHVFTCLNLFARVSIKAFRGSIYFLMNTDSGNNLVLSLPFLNEISLSYFTEQEGIQFEKTVDNHLRLLQQAKKSIVICSPFIDLSEDSRIQEVLLDRLQNDISVSILVRQPLQRTSELLEELAEFGADIRIYHYARGEQKKRVDSSIHAKVIIVDEEKGYTGSADLRGWKSNKNFEVGFSLQPEQAKILSRIFHQIFKVSKPVC